MKPAVVLLGLVLLLDTAFAAEAIIAEQAGRGELDTLI